MTKRLPFEIRCPGTWIDLSDKDAAWQVQGQLGTVQSAFDEAAMALMFFERSLADPSSRLDRDAWQRDANRRAELSRQLERDRFPDGMPLDHTAWDEMRVDVDRMGMLENWHNGVVPQSMLHHIPFIYAKAFLYAVDQIGKVLDRLAERSDLPAEAQAACTAFYDSFPELREVRNSAQHIEDRGRGLGKGGKPLQLKPINSRMISAPGGALVINSLNGNRFGATMADGHYGEVEVSSTSLAIVRDRVEAVLSTLPWRGPADHRPR